jgi:polysaccharide biosynthesis/export protein
MKQLFLIFFVFFFIAYLILPTCMHAQQKESIKQQAEMQLQQMTPQQIDAKLKELGMTRAEAEAKANALGVDLQKYLGIQTGKQEIQQPIETQPQETREQVIQQAVPIPSAVPQILFSIPGFEGRTGAAGLQPYGYNLFQYPTSTFEPVLNMPTSPSYVLGPGDELLLTMWGETQLFSQLTITREGNIVVPNAGPVPAQGVTVDALKARLLKRLTAFYSGLRNGGSDANTWLDVSIGKLRTIQIFVLGEVKKPGGYAISSMSTSFLALYVAGGPNINGTLRSIEVLRNNKTISTIDFYDYALRGDKSKDIRLQDGDIVFVKTIGTRAAITGNVIRPAIYELKPNETLKDILLMCGGLQVNAYYDRAHVERIIPFSERKHYEKNMLDLDMKFSSAEDLLKSNLKLENGDIISIFQISDFLQNRVTILGNVKKPGVFELQPGMHMKDVLLAADSLDRNTFSERGSLFRIMPNLRREVISFSPRLALIGDLPNNIELRNEDSIVIYKESQFFPAHTVSVGGAVRNPGTYPRYDNMTVSDLVVMAGGLTEGASLFSWELARMDTTKVGALSKINKFNVPEKYWQNHWEEIGDLNDFDHLMVPFNPKYNRERVVEITGYVLYPGAYALQKEGEKLSNIIKRAGGLRPGAYLEGSTLFRKWKNSGLVSIDFVKALSDTESLDNINVLHEDSVYISPTQDLIYVRGEVFMPAAVAHKEGANLSYYLGQAGGLKESGDEDRVYVTLPNGKKWEKGWFILPSPEIPGGTVVYVPRKIETEDKTLSILTSWATIMASLATMMIAIVQVTK